MKKILQSCALVFLALVATNMVHAQSSDDAKQALVQRVLALWHIEDAAITMTQRPATDALLQARVALQGRVNAEKQEATLKAIVPDVQKYINEATPIVRAEALRLKGPTVGPLLMKNFSEEELRALVALFESPVKKKFESLVPQFERALGEKVVESSREAIDPKIQILTKDIGLKLRAAVVAP